MKKKNKILIVLAAIVLIASFMFCTKIVDADSGWDSSYDSGWDSGSDWGSSSWDYDSWDSGGSYSSGNMSLGEFMIIFAIFVIIFIIATREPKKKAKPTNVRTREHNYYDLSEERLHKIDPTLNINELKNTTFDIYNKVQNAWMDFDYEALRKYISDELYNMYESQLKVLQAKKQKNIMENITYLDAKVVDVDISNGVEKVKMYLNIKMKDYVVDNNNNVVRGNKSITNNLEYLITLNRNVEKVKLDKCPSCNAPIDIKAGGKCSYCGGTIVNNNNEFVMSKKECIGQKRI